VKSPPITRGFARSAEASTKRSKKELAKPGINIGNVTLKKVRSLDAPIDADASSSAGSRFLIIPRMLM